MPVRSCAFAFAEAKGQKRPRPLRVPDPGPLGSGVRFTSRFLLSREIAAPDKHGAIGIARLEKPDKNSRRFMAKESPAKTRRKIYNYGEKRPSFARKKPWPVCGFYLSNRWNYGIITSRCNGRRKPPESDTVSDHKRKSENAFRLNRRLRQPVFYGEIKWRILGKKGFAWKRKGKCYGCFFKKTLRL